MREEERTQSVIVELATIVSLQSEPGKPKLVGDIGMERLKQG
jgi:hypothetical protein